MEWGDQSVVWIMDPTIKPGSHDEFREGMASTRPSRGNGACVRVLLRRSATRSSASPVWESFESRERYRLPDVEAERQRAMAPFVEAEELRA